MIILSDLSAVETLLTSHEDDALKWLLQRRVNQLSYFDLSEVARFIVVQQGDVPEQLQPDPCVNLVDGCHYGQPDFVPSWEWIERHKGWFELTFVLSDDGFGHVLLIPDDNSIHPRLLRLCRDHA